MPDEPQPKKKLVALIRPPANIGEMTQEAIDAYTAKIWAAGQARARPVSR